MLENLNWYPGHMKKTRELIKENLKLVDGVIEVVDGRIPESSRNPIIKELIGKKKTVILINKVDLADENKLKAWKEYFHDEGAKVVFANSLDGAGIKQLFGVLENLEKEVNEGRVRKRPFRIMIVGVPNVGKSSLINRLTGRKAAQTGDRPGVTRGKQWLSMSNGMQLLDTPGILWPKFESKVVGVNLGLCGSIKDEIMPLDDLCIALIEILNREYPGAIEERYKLGRDMEKEVANKEENPLDGSFDDECGEISAAIGVMEKVALKRGFLRSGKKIDYERTAKTMLDEFRSGKLGRMTLEMPKNKDLRLKIGDS